MIQPLHREHYEAQQKYAQMLFVALDVPKWRLLRKYRAFLEAEKFRDTHQKCCEWANENDE